jgi:hypothetical protein
MMAVQSNGRALTPDFGAGADRVVRKYRGDSMRLERSNH